MNCAWDMFINLLPVRMRKSAEKYLGISIEEIRLRIGRNAEILTMGGSEWLEYTVTKEDLAFCVNMASRYSPWSAKTASFGYITAPGGHRVGICGQAVLQDGRMNGFRSITSVCIRAAKDIYGIAQNASMLGGSSLILGRPGSGKTTLLRDMVRQLSEKNNVIVVDEREEIYPVQDGKFCYDIGLKTDVISGCSKPAGIDAALRTMRPDYIAVDEITAQEDCAGLLQAGWCGVKLLATAHAQSKYDLLKRPVYKPIVESGLFDHLLILREDKTWHYERMTQCC